MPETSIFHRKQLASKLADSALQTSATSASGSGVFLAAPRRTGKSTFVREDLRPELEAKGALVLYVDLWTDRRADPGDVMVSAVRTELAKYEGVITRLAKSSGMDKVTVGGLGFSLDRVGLGAQVSITTALAALSDEVRKPIVFIIDEVQHAITTDKGYDALFALKAARDELNSSAHHGLRIIATGSNRDKLAMLRNSKDQAFFGAPLVSFPHLGDDYVQWFCDGVDLPAPLDVGQIRKLFERALFRPEILGAAADALRFDLELAAADVRKKFTAAVDAEIEADQERTLRVIRGLTPLQSAVLRVLAAYGEKYAPFEPATFNTYRMVLHEIDPKYKAKPEISNVQQALIALQEKSLIWKEKRGIYSLEESATAELLSNRGLMSLHGMKQKPDQADTDTKPSGASPRSK